MSTQASNKADLRVSTMYPTEYLSAADLRGKAVTLKILNVKIDAVQMQGGKKERKPVIYLEKTNKKILVNKTNTRALAVLFSSDGNDWIGKRIAISPDIDLAPDGSGEVAAIRITGSPDATPERTLAFNKAWKGERKRGALIKRLKQAQGLLETSRAAIPVVEAEEKAAEAQQQADMGVAPEDDIFGDSAPEIPAEQQTAAPTPPKTELEDLQDAGKLAAANGTKALGVWWAALNAAQKRMLTAFKDATLKPMAVHMDESLAGGPPEPPPPSEADHIPTPDAA